MTLKHPTILIDDGQWHIALEQEGSYSIAHSFPVVDMELDMIVEQLCQWFSDRSMTDCDVVLAVDSTYCFCETISLKELPNKYRHQAMMYRLEEILPVPAEDLVGHFIESGDHATALAAKFSKLKPIVDALESRSLLVEHICPSALLAVQTYLESKSAVSADIFLWQHDQWIEMFELNAGKLSSWSIISSSDEDMNVHLSLLAVNQERELTAVCCELNSNNVSALKEIKNLKVIGEYQQPLIDAAVAGAQRVTEGTLTPWVDFRRDQLAASDPYRQIRKPLNFTFAAMVFFLLTICGVFIWQSNEYRMIKKGYDQSQLEIFSSTLPNQTVQVGAILLRLNSELNGLNRLRGQANDLPALPSALERMRELITLLPDQNQFDVDHIQINDTSITLSGKTESLTVANNIVSALENGNPDMQIAGFSTELPKTELLNNGSVTFTIQGKPKIVASSGVTQQ